MKVPTELSQENRIQKDSLGSKVTTTRDGEGGAHYLERAPIAISSEALLRMTVLCNAPYRYKDSLINVLLRASQMRRKATKKMRKTVHGIVHPWPAIPTESSQPQPSEEHRTTRVRQGRQTSEEVSRRAAP